MSLNEDRKTNEALSDLMSVQQQAGYKIGSFISNLFWLLVVVFLIPPILIGLASIPALVMNIKQIVLNIGQYIDNPSAIYQLICDFYANIGL